ncbi:hypothetical protein ASPZODRAFT_156754 [Penicilliopsis zonata CBS 506.65]|uniref:Nucleoporin Nup120/160-domain-containing protein n=1 Tax=Penicilliopsis zonata CBS 506.65 TaxID=1073090 RepID=A0A1L9SRE1_9EURO|nr:hypothetical protein ASPZODRAFT_156754 [Penicilliopsis zonata CBS 506.65]OJJ49676.1 hypothetical protein ASPZODRAFT_156754 [Penicilliopsis zonata CBS 506.65]
MVKLYKETRVDLRPFSPKTTVNIQIPTQESSAPRRARFAVTPFAGRDITIAKDEEEFARRFLASQSSVYFRKRKIYPRTFLWRVVEGNRVLEIQCTDLAKSGVDHSEYVNTLRLDFQEEIIPAGVAFADLEEHEVLNVFVITVSKRLHTLTLRPEIFRRAAAIDENVSDWCKSCIPAPLAFSHPHRLYASSPLELFVALDNGSLLHLTRRAGDDGSHWSPLTLDERTWGSSIRGLVKWHAQPSIKFQGRNLDPNVANAIATTSDQTYVFTICLNHTLKIWNLTTKKLVASRDLLDRDIQQHDGSQYSLNPSESSFIRVFNAERAIDGGYRYFVVTYSPFEDGRFKFWAVKGGLTTQLVIEDLFPEAVLRPIDPDPSGNMFWSIADFQIKSMEEGKRMEFWILWRNSSLYQIYTLHFDFQTLVSNWENNWVSTALETRREDPPPTLASDTVDPTAKWMQYFLQPGRYPTEVLETALAIYQEALNPLSASGLPKGNTPLQERLCATITPTVSLRKYAEDDLDFSRYATDVDTKWRQFWQVAEDLNRRRLDALSLAYDSYNDLLWVLLQDSCALIRECSSTELLLHNSGTELREGALRIQDRWEHRSVESEIGNFYDQASSLIHIASDFRKSFSADLAADCWAALEVEIFSDPSVSVPDRMAEFQARCNFGERISDKTFDGLCAALNQHMNIYKLPSNLFDTIIATIPNHFHGKDSELSSTHFGIAVMVSGAQETILHTRQILFDLLLLITFLESEVNQEEDSDFDFADFYITLVDILKEYEMMAWLSANIRKCSSRISKPSTDTSAPTFSLKEPEWQGKKEREATILEDMFAHPIKPYPNAKSPQSHTLTLGIRDLLTWVTRQGEVAFPNALVHIQCNLIANNNIDLAYDFLRFQPSTPWATYAKGRLYLSMSDFDTAALYFQKAAYLLSCGRAIGNLHEMSSTLLDVVAMDSFNNGLPKYFQHILSLFEQARAFSYVADFASLALQALESENRSEQDREYTDMRTDLLLRLFHASLKTCQFDQAYSALSRYRDVALQRAALGSLIEKILSTFEPSTAGLREILHFPTALMPNIASHVDETLVSLAKKQFSFTSLTDGGRKAASNAPDYTRLLQAYRIARNDYRGAAEVAYRNVQRLREARDAPSSGRALIKAHDREEPRPAVEEDDPESKEIRQELLSLINLLACVDKSEAYILVEREEEEEGHHQQLSTDGRRRSTAQQDEDGNVFMEDTDLKSSIGSTGRRLSSGTGFRVSNTPASGRRDSKASGSGTNIGGPVRRVIVTLDHLRREFQAELDRVSRIERGDWEFGVLDADEADNDDTMVLS